MECKGQGFDRLSPRNAGAGGSGQGSGLSAGAVSGQVERRRNAAKSHVARTRQELSAEVAMLLEPVARPELARWGDAFANLPLRPVKRKCFGGATGRRG
jgi:hypothetical protein